MLELFIRGGPVMYPLAILSIMSLAIIVERVWFLRRARMDTKEFMTKINEALSGNQIEEAAAICEEYHGPLGSVFREALKKHQRSREEIEKAIEGSGSVEVAKMERNLIVLGTIGKLAPLIGFFGTVIGMVKAFESIAASGLGDPQVVAGGISQSLITTAGGLAVAIPTVFAQYIFIHWINSFVLEMQESSIKFLDGLTDLEEKLARRTAQRDMIGGEYLEI
jgi:biopolymer transport protein ExbB